MISVIVMSIIRWNWIRFVLRSPERVLWAKEGVVGAEAVVVTGLRPLLLLGYRRQNLKHNFSLLKITSIKSLFLATLVALDFTPVVVSNNTKLGINCEISNLKNIVL